MIRQDRSLARKLLMLVLLLSAGVTALLSIGTFFGVQDALARQKIEHLKAYVTERARMESELFQDVRRFQIEATASLKARYALLDQAVADREFERLFPLQADGTRRSRDIAFDGEVDAGGGRVFGMGAFLSRGRDVTPSERRLLVAAWQVVSSFGEAQLGFNDNFYFYTPTDRLVMFGPRREDRLQFYRKTAPADLSFVHEEMAQNMLPANNPQRATRCTRLRRLISDPTGERLTTGCQSPVDIDGRHLGAFGTTIQLKARLLGSLQDAQKNATGLVIADDGALIAFPGFKTPGMASPETVARYEKELGLTALSARIRATHHRVDVVRSADGRSLVAFASIPQPNWYLLSIVPMSAITGSAAASASFILLLGAFAVALQGWLVFWLSRREIADPLMALTQAAGRPSLDEDFDRLARRDDEIGALARALGEARGRVDEVVASLEDKVRDRTAELEEANAAKSQFLANMSHELRTPLNGIVATSDMLEPLMRTGKTRELVRLVNSSARVLEAVLADILDFSKMEAGRLDLDSRPVDLARTVRDLVELHRAAAEKKRLALICEVDPDVQGAWTVDAVRLTQILSNLVSNAVKFTEAGSVTVTVSPSPAGVRFEVVDTGIGFDEDTARRLFRRFEQADSSITRRFGGTGLGLAIAMGLVERMGGGMAVSSSPGEGSAFGFVLPLERAEGDAPAAGAVNLQETEINLNGVRVLLAEDHEVNQRIVRLILEPTGVELAVVGDGQQALDALAARSFDLVLMDMQMPVMDGLSAVRALRLREAEGDRRTPVLMLTANALSEHVAEGATAGADGHLSKPIRPLDLLQAMAAALAPDRRAAA